MKKLIRISVIAIMLIMISFAGFSQYTASAKITNQGNPTYTFTFRLIDTQAGTTIGGPFTVTSADPEYDYYFDPNNLVTSSYAIYRYNVEVTDGSPITKSGSGWSAAFNALGYADQQPKPVSITIN
jgi:hypothetical protein